MPHDKFGDPQHGFKALGNTFHQAVGLLQLNLKRRHTFICLVGLQPLLVIGIHPQARENGRVQPYLPSLTHLAHNHFRPHIISNALRPGTARLGIQA